MYVLMNDTLSPIPVCPESIYYYSAVDALYALCEMAVGMLCVWCVGLNDLKEHLIEIILTRYCNGDMICDSSRNDAFYIIILIFTEKHIKMNSGVVFVGICTKQRCFLKSLEHYV